METEPIREPGKNHWCVAGSHAFQCTDKTCKWPFEVQHCPEHPGKSSIVSEWAKQQK